MLGVGSGSSKSGKIRRLIKNGLQAWYKADETQAPLGEEEIANGDFSGGDTGWSAEQAALNTSSGTGEVTATSSTTAGIKTVTTINLVQNKTYNLKFDVVNATGNFTSGNIKEYSNNTVGAWDGIGSYDITFTYLSSSSQLRWLKSVNNGDVLEIGNVSVREVINSVRDCSPNNNNGVLYSGKCLHFDDGNYIGIEYWKSKAIDANTKATFVTWVKPHDVAHPGDFIFGSDSSTDWFYLAIKNGKLDLGWKDSGWAGSPTTGALPTLGHTWYRAVAVVDGLTCRVYLNGEFVFSKTAGSSFTLHSDGISIGCQGDDVGDHLYGDLADFQIYDKAWTASDVTYDWENPDKDVFDGSSNISPTDCTALYRLNEGAGNRLYNAAPVLGANLIANGDFATGTSAGWTSSGATPEVVDHDGKTNALHVSTSTSNQGVNQVILQTNTTYLVKFDLKVISGYVFLGKYGNEVTGTYIGETPWASYEVNWKSSDDNYFRVYSTGDAAEFYIDNVSVKEISLSNSYVQEDWVPNRWITAQPYIPQYAMSSYSKKMLFDGSDNLVDCGSDSSIDNIFDGGGTWSAWFSAETDGESNTGTILSKDKVRIRTTADSGGDVTMEFIHFFNTQEGKWTCPTDAVLLNKINHILIVYDNSNVNNNPIIYINGVSQTVTRDQAPTGTFTTDASDELTIGAKDDSGVDCFDGFIDEVSVWDKELTATEVQEIFNAGMALDCRDHSAYLGSELVDSGDFEGITQAESTTGTDWTTGVGWTISGGKANSDGTQSVSYLSQTGIVNLTSTYKVEFTVSGSTSGTLKFLKGNASTAIDVTSNGTYTYYAKWDGLTGDVVFQALNFVGSVDNISVKELRLNGYWRNNGADTWTDLSPHGNNGTVNGSPTTIQLQEVPYFKKDTFGLPMNKVRERALNLDGDSYVEIADDNSINPTSAITVACWVYWNETLSNGTRTNDIGIVSKWKSSTEDYMLIKGTNTTFDFYIGTDYERSNDLEMDTPGWVYIAGTYDGSTIKTYKNGVSNSSGTSVSRTIPNTAQVLEIGRYRETADRSYPERIDDVKIYNRALSAGELLRNYKATKSKHKNNTVSNWSDDFSDSFI